MQEADGEDEKEQQEGEGELIKYSEQPDSKLYISAGHSHWTLLEIDLRFFIHGSQVLSPEGEEARREGGIWMGRRRGRSRRGRKEQKV